MYKSNLQEIEHECMLFSPSSPDSCLRRHLSSPLYSCYKIYVCTFCFQMVFSILNVSQIYLVYLSFQNVFLSKTSKITLYFNWSLLCWFTSYFYALVDSFFLSALHCTIYLLQNSQLIHLKWIVWDQKFTSMSKRCNIWKWYVLLKVIRRSI